MSPDDFALLTAYARREEAPAFTELVRRHADLVYGAARRQTGDHHLAEEITQAVFVILARKAASIRSGEHLVGFLVKTTRYAALDAMKHRHRHESHLSRTAQPLENLAAETRSAAQSSEVEPLLDEALASLSPGDQAAVATRYLESRSFREVAQTLSCSEDAAKKRVARALEKLRTFLVHRGVTLSAAALAEAIAAQSLKAAPAGLAVLAANTAMNSASVAPATLLLIQNTASTIAAAKLQSAAVAVAAGLAVAGATVTIVHFSRREPPAIHRETAALSPQSSRAAPASTVAVVPPNPSAAQPQAQTVAQSAQVYPRPPTAPLRAVASAAAAADPQMTTETVQRKLASIILPKLEFRELSLAESLELLEKKIRDSDPEGLGVHFIGGKKLSDARITIFALTNIPAVEAVKYVTSLANTVFRVTELGVEILDPSGDPAEAAPAKDKAGGVAVQPR